MPVTRTGQGRNLEPVEALPVAGNGGVPACRRQQERHCLRPKPGAGIHDVGLRLAVGVVDEHGPARGQLGRALLDPGGSSQLSGPGQRRQRAGGHQSGGRVQLSRRLDEQVRFQVYPIATARAPRVVSRQVIGINATEKRSARTSATVRLTPSTATDAFADHLVQEPLRRPYPDPTPAIGFAGLDPDHPSDGVHVTLDQVAVEGVAHGEGRLEIDATPTASSASVLRLAVSADTSARNQPSPTSVADRHTPLTHIDPPGWSVRQFSAHRSSTRPWRG